MNQLPQIQREEWLCICGVELEVNATDWAQVSATRNTAGTNQLKIVFDSKTLQVRAFVEREK